MSRIGLGFDIHRLVEGRPLFLAGVRVQDSPGLLGHSDADVVLHAVIDAALGAAGLAVLPEVAGQLLPRLPRPPFRREPPAGLMLPTLCCTRS